MRNRNIQVLDKIKNNEIKQWESNKEFIIFKDKLIQLIQEYNIITTTDILVKANIL